MKEKETPTLDWMQNELLNEISSDKNRDVTKSSAWFKDE